VQSKDQLEALYDDEPTDGYWHELWGREEELWISLLLHARVAGPSVEPEVLQTALEFSQRKLIVQSQEHDVALARELIDVLEMLKADAFTPGEARLSLIYCENWGSVLEKKKDKAQDMFIADFLKGYGLTKIGRDRSRGSVYSAAETIEKLKAHLPVVRPTTNGELSDTISQKDQADAQIASQPAMVL
jgi:hypothetical protein